MRYWVRLLKQVEDALPELLVEGSQWESLGRMSGNIRVHQMKRQFGGYIISLNRLIADSSKHRFGWLLGPAVGRVLTGKLYIGIYPASDRRLARVIPEVGLFGITAGGDFIAGRGHVITRSVEKASFVLLIRKKPRPRRYKSLRQLIEQVNAGESRLSTEYAAHLLTMARKHYPKS